MSQFTAPLLVTPLDDGKTWIIVTDDFRYDVGTEGSGDTVTVPQWMSTDFASVPRLVWWFAAPWGRHGHAAVIHDAGYYLQDRTRAEYDRIFLEAMVVLGVGRFRRRAMYQAVHWFAGLAWRANARRNAEEPGWKLHDPALLGLSPVTSPSTELEHQREEAPAVHQSTKAVQAARDTGS
ncbi:hypothetical protein BH20ACT2_BH20ACT2_11850 [soil metagenome]